MYVGDEEFRVCFADKSTHFHSPLGICQALPSTCALSHVIPHSLVSYPQGLLDARVVHGRSHVFQCTGRLILGLDVSTTTGAAMNDGIEVALVAPDCQE